MQVTIQSPVENRIKTFLEYLKKRAEDKVHENNIDLIADFVDKVLVVELKRLNNDPEVFDETIEIPDQVLVEPLLRAKKSFDLSFEEFLKKNGAPVTSSIDLDEVLSAPSKPQSLPDPKVVAGLPRKGNGHKVAKKRALTDSEKDTIKMEFLALNGQIADDACQPIHQKLDPEVTIFQVTGFVSYLHRKIAEGTQTVRNLDNYLTFIQSHRDKWATYNSPKYVALRKQNALPPHPKMAGSFKKTTA
jgi:hypothetical protein